MNTQTATYSTPSDFNAAPMPPGPGYFSTIKGLAHPVLNFFYASFKKYGDVVRLPFLNKNIYLVSHPDDVAHVMKKRTDIYSKGGLGFHELKIVLGNGLGPTMGETWQRQRKLYQPGFTSRANHSYINDVVRVALKWNERWKKNAQEKKPVNIGKEMLEMNLHVACNTLIGADLPDNVLAEISDEFVYIVQDMEHRVGQLIKFPLWVPTPANIKFKKTMDKTYRFLDDIIEQRTQSKNPRDDLLSIIIKGSGHPDDEANTFLKRDHVLNFFFGGHETSGYTLAWLFYLLAKHPEVDAKVEAELDEVLLGNSPTIEHLKQLPYTYAVIQETLRLYPIFPMLPRIAKHNDTIRGYKVPQNTYINICPYLTNRHPDFWESPDQFIPERFTNGEKIHPYAYIPFGAGPTICIGRTFGLMTTLMIFATLRQRYRIRLETDQAIPILMPGFSLQPEKPINLLLDDRRHSLNTCREGLH